MNYIGTIINLILKIFGAIFEEDVKRRQPPPTDQRSRERQPGAPPGRQAPGRPGPGHPAGRHPAGRHPAGRHPAGRQPAGRVPGTPGRPAPGQQPGQGRPQPRPMDPENPKSIDEWLREIFGIPDPPQPPATKPVPQQVVQQERHETLQEHIRAQERQIRKQKERIAAMERRVRSRMGEQDDHYATESRSSRFKLPGRTPLQKAVYGSVILGPCKARKGTFFLDI